LSCFSLSYFGRAHKRGWMKDHPSAARLISLRGIGPLAVLVGIFAMVGPEAAFAQDSVTRGVSTESAIIVTAPEVASAYGAPTGLSRGRFSNLTSAYVLPPGSVYAGLIYQGDAQRFNRPDHTFTQEIEVGLPYRFGIAIENSIE